MVAFLNYYKIAIAFIKGFTIQLIFSKTGTGLSTHRLNRGCYRDVKLLLTSMFKIVVDEKSSFYLLEKYHLLLGQPLLDFTI